MMFIVLMLILLWQLGYIREYEPPCTGRLCEQAEAATAPPVIIPEEEGRNDTRQVDVHILCQAIAVAETSNCTTGSALTHNNCHGITKRSGGYVDFARTEDSFAACEDLWRRKYVRFPDIALASKWSSPGAAEGWLKNVVSAYESRL